MLEAPKHDPYAALLERLEAIESDKMTAAEPPALAVEPPRKGFWARLVG
jgi:hypothetical protein